MNSEKRDNVLIFDTTLRDGEQSPGCSMTVAEKVRIADALVELGVDIIEAGFPVASPGDFSAVEEIARVYGSRARICALARCKTGDIERAAAAISDAEYSRIHVFLATSSIHREYKLRMSKEDVVSTAVEMVSRCLDKCGDVEFSPEDAIRTEPDFLCEVVEKVIAAGATTINIPDTVGYAVPALYAHTIGYLIENVSNAKNVVFSSHCHDDLGLAVANSLAAVEAGARQIECTINGVGERAGNAALEEVVMALRTRADHFGCGTNIVTERLLSVSTLVSKITGMKVQRNKAIVGENAFAHEAGIHQHGMIANASTYEIMKPEDIGRRGTALVLGKHSGRHAFAQRVSALGYDLSTEEFQAAFEGFIELADKKKQVFDSDIIALIEARSDVPSSPRWKLVRFHVVSGSGVIPYGCAELIDEYSDKREPAIDVATGDGPLDAVFQAILRITGLRGTLRDYQATGVSEGTDALAEVTVTVDFEGMVCSGHGVSTDTVEASVKAYLASVNHAILELDARTRKEPRNEAKSAIVDTGK